LQAAEAAGAEVRRGVTVTLLRLRAQF